MVILLFYPVKILHRKFCIRCFIKLPDSKILYGGLNMHQQTIRILFDHINFCMDFLLDIDGNDDIYQDDTWVLLCFSFASYQWL